jgi:hypothetical protein
MSNKDKALWTLVAAYVGAIIEVPGIVLNRVLGTSMFLALVAFVICSIVSARKHKEA